MNNDAQIQAIERNLKEAKEIKEMSNALLRLEKNKDFLAVVKNGYFKDEAVRLVHLRGDPGMQTPERQESIMKQVDSISNFHQYLINITRKAEMAEKAIANDEATLEDLRTEGV